VTVGLEVYAHVELLRLFMEVFDSSCSKYRLHTIVALKVVSGCAVGIVSLDEPYRPVEI